MEIQKSKIIVEKTVGEKPEHDATRFIQDDSFLQSLMDLFSSSATSVIELNLELGSVQWNTLTAKQQEELIVGALNGSNFKTAIEYAVNNGAPNCLLKLKFFANGSLIGAALDFALNTVYNENNRPSWQIAIGALAGAGVGTAVSGVIGAAGVGIGFSVAAFAAGAVASFAVTSTLNDTFDYNRLKITNNQDLMDDVDSKGGLNLKIYAETTEQLKSAINNSGVLELDSDKKVIITNTFTGKTYELIRKDDYNNLYNELERRGFGNKSTYDSIIHNQPIIDGTNVPLFELYWLKKQNPEIDGFDDTGIIPAINVSNVKYLLLENNLFFPQQGNQVDNIIYLDKDAKEEKTYGMLGSDLIYGTEQNDIIYGDEGDNTEKESVSYRHYDYDVLVGNEGNDLLYGEQGNDVLIGDTANSIVYPENDLKNLINNKDNINLINFETANDGNDYLNGGEGDDLLIGGGGNDILIGGEDEDTLYGGSGNDVIIAGDSSLSIDSLKNLSSIQDNIDATAYQTQNGGENKLYGDAGNDILIGDKGNDILDGGSDADYMFGGSGNDTYVFDDDSNMNTDNVIEKVNEGDSDTIDFSNVSSAVDVDLTQTNAKVFANDSDVSGIENIYGTNSNDKITGQGLNNVLVGNEGNDTLTGGTGDDVLIAGTAKKKPLLSEERLYNNEELKGIINNKTSIDSEDFESNNGGTNELHGGDDNDLLIGDKGNDTLYGETGDDYLYGGKGNDVLLGGEGSDNLKGEDGNDILIAGETTLPIEQVKNLTINSSIDVTEFETSESGQNTLNGGADNDILIGDKGNDTLYGDGGNDIIYGGKGNDTINGDEGEDILIGGEGTDTIAGGMDNDILVAGETILSANAIKNMVTSGNVDLSKFESGKMEQNTLTGGSGDDILIGDVGNDTLDGEIGNDLLFGGKGKDSLNGGYGTDVLVGGEGSDTLHGGEHADVLIAGNTNLSKTALQNLINQKQGINVNSYTSNTKYGSYLYGDGGNDLLIGDKGNDELHGGLGDDSLYGGDGNDNLYGEIGNDLLIGGEGDDTIDGGTGDDQIYGEEGNDTIDGGSGKDQIHGGEGDDTIDGGSGDDYIYGEEDNDIINGGMGNDHLYGGSGKDTIKGDFGDDHLYAGAGNGDVLIGGIGMDYLYNYEGNATLQGGVGYDTYYVSSSASNIIYDEDNQGSVNFNNKTLRGAGKDDYKENDTWMKDGVRYVWTGNTLTINGRTTIQNFTNGALGITLTKPKEDDDDEDPTEADDKMTEPIVLDLNGDGVKTTIAAQGINFDYNNDGFSERIAWADPEDGVLVADLNNNGKIDNGTEVLTAETLANFDTNNDGIIDENDENFSALKVMKTDGSLLSMEEAEIASINTSVTATDIYDENGNNMFGEGTFTKTDGSVNNFGEYNLVTDFSNTQATDILEETEDVAGLPDIEGQGRLYSLHQAILHDESGELQELVENFVSATDDSVRNNLIEQILYKWADCENTIENSRGEYIDAKHLALWEAFQGIDFVSRHEGELDPTKPNKEAADKIETKVQKFMNEVYAKLMKQTHLQTYYEAIDKTNAKYDLSPVVAMLDAAIANNATTGRELVYQVVKMIKGLGIDKYSNFFDPKNDNCLYTKYTQNDRDLKYLIDTIGTVKYINYTGEGEGTAADDSFQSDEDDEYSHFHALAGDDVMYGGNGKDNFAACDGDDILDGGDGDDVLASHDGNDIIFGGKGNDIIQAAWGNDIIFGGDGDDLIYPDHSDDFHYSEDGDDIIRGGQGNDTIYSMTGNDTFIFNLGDGQDTVYEKQGVDTFYFGNGIAWTDLTFEQSGSDMLIKINNTTDQITVKDWFSQSEDGQYHYDNNKIEIFEFADGSKHYLDEITIDNSVNVITYNMSDLDNDYIEIASNYKTTVNLKSGWNHIVEGTNSNDTFVLSEQGTDALIQNFSGNNTIIFGEGITLENTVFEIDEEGLHISFNGFDAHLTIQGDLEGTTTLKFVDETTVDDIKTFLKKEISYINHTMSQNTAELTLLGADDVTATGNNLDNTIRGNEGNTTFEGKGGNDRLESLYGGNDTYIFNIGDGEDYIKDFGGNDTINFGQGITAQNICFLKDLVTNNLELRINTNNGFDDKIIIENYFGSDNNKIEKIAFSDGTEITDITPYISAYASDSDLILPDNIIDGHLWGEGNTSATGNVLNNWFGGNSGDNTFNGGLGNDSFWDGIGGNERYIYNLGDGYDFIEDTQGLDAIIFGTGITKDNIIFSHNEEDNGLEITFQNQEGSIYIANYFNGDENKIELFKFADGSVIDNISPYLDSQIENIQNDSIVMDSTQLNVTLSGNGNASVLANSLDNNITGNAGNNTYAAGGGDDTITDILGGNDTYLYNINNGNDTITDLGGVDTIKFGPDIYPDNLKFERVENNLLISFRDDWRDGSLSINNYFLNDGYKVENFAFNDGTVLTDISDRITGVAPSENYTLAEDTIIDTVRMAGSDNISVTGNNNDNTICGNSGNNTFEGKGGNDILIDHNGGNDTYIYNIGDGFDTIDDIGGYDTIKFGSAVTLENLAFKQTATDLEIWFHNIENNGLCIKNFFSNPDNKIEKFELADGTVITDITNYITAIASDGNIVLPAGVAQAHLWGEGNTSATGNDLDNYISGNSGNNTFEGKGGHDYFWDDQGGNDTYIYNLGDGYDTINDFSGNDTIKFGNNISAQNLEFIRNDGNLQINFKTDDGEFIEGGICIENYFYDDNKRIEKIEFADGSTITNIDKKVNTVASENDFGNYWNYSFAQLWGNGDINYTGSYSDETIFGNSGNNTYNPQGGTDYIYDTEGGNDTYIYNQDSNNKFILDIGGNDSIKFGSGIDTQNTKFVQNGNNLRIYFPNYNNAFIQIENYFISNDNKIENFIFADGTTLTDLTNHISGIAIDDNISLTSNQSTAYLLGEGNNSVTGSSNDDTIRGNSGNNTYNAGLGNDNIEDKNGGDDTYIYNLGDGFDFIVDIGGNDKILFGQGISLDNVKFENINNDLSINIDKNDIHGNIYISKYFKSDLRKIESFEFADGTTITDVSNLITGISIKTDYTLEEGSQITSLYMRGNGDLSVVGNSSDNHFSGNSGNNTFVGKAGNDSFFDNQGGNDTYIYNIGDGYDYITDIGGNDTIKLGEGITASMLTMNKWDAGQLEITFDGIEGNIVIDNYFNNVNNRIEKIILHDGTEITNFTPYMTYIETDSDFVAFEKSRDIVAIGEGDISLTGNDNENHFTGNSGNNTFVGKGGSDSYWDEAGGNDTYIYNYGDSWDWIHDKYGNDTIQFTEGITTANTQFVKQNNSLEIRILDENGSCIGNTLIDNYFDESNDYKIETVKFADGTIITDFSDKLHGLISETENVVLTGNQIEGGVWGEANLNVTGNNLDNHINGNSGNNVMIGGQGNDSFWDEEGGDDTYVYNIGDGFDWIHDKFGYDTIQLGEGITASMLTMNKWDDGQLEITFDGIEGNIVIDNYFNDADCKIEKIILNDGTEITDFTPYFTFAETDTNYTAAENSKVQNITATGDGNISLTGNSKDNTICGNSGNNTFEGKTGNDNLIDNQGGNDTYIYNLGDGNDYINDVGGNDTIQLGTGIELNNIGIMRDDYNNMHLRFNNGEEIIIEAQYVSDENKIENIQFADGTVVNDINALTTQIGSALGNIILPDGYTEGHLWGDGNYNITGNSGDNFIRGNAGNNILEGKAGNDSYWDEEGGNDTYIYNLGDGHDYISDLNGNDTIQFGSGINVNDVTFSQTENGGLSITFANQECSIYIDNYFNTNEDRKIENFSFADGTTLTDISSLIIPYSSPDNTNSSNDFDVNLLIQEINSYAPEGEMINTEYNQNQDELILAMS